MPQSFTSFHHRPLATIILALLVLLPHNPLSAFEGWSILAPSPISLEDPIPLPNPSFELPELDAENSFFDGVQGWTISGNPATTWRVPTSPASPSTDGDQYLFGASTRWSIHTTFGRLETNTRYRLTVDVFPLPGQTNELVLRLRDSFPVGPQVYNEVIYRPGEGREDFELPSNQWTTISLGMNTSVVPGRVGSNAQIFIEGTQVAIDNVRLVKVQGPRTFHISSSEGSNSNSGLSPAQAWRTFAPLAGYLPLAPGDQLLLRAGDTFPDQLTLRGKGTADAPITLSRYGDGPRPIVERQDVEFDVCIIWNNASHAIIRGISGRNSKIGLYLRYEWTDSGSTDVLIEDCHFEDMPDPTLDPSKHNFEYAWSDAIWVGGQAWNNAEFTTRLNNLTIRNVTADNVAHLFGTGWYYPLPYKGRVTNLLMEDCLATNTLSGAFQVFDIDGGIIRRVHSIGGGGKDTWSGLAYGFTQSVRNMLIEDCQFSFLDRAQAADGVGFDFEGDAENVIFRDNIVHDCDASGMLILSTGGPNSNLTIERNTFYNNAADPWNSQINSEIQGSNAPHTGVIRNNVIMRRSPEVNFFNSEGNWTTLVRENNVLGEFPDVAQRPRWWDFQSDLQGWGGFNGWTNPRVENGALRGTSSNEDPFFESPPTWSNSVLQPVVWVRMSQTAGEFGQIFWQTAVDPIWVIEQSAFFPIIADGQMRDYFINIDDAGAKGVVTELRLDPTIAAGSEMAIEHIRIVERAAFDVQPPAPVPPPPLDMTFVSIGTQDGHILESSRDSNTGGSVDTTSGTFRIGDDAQARAYRGFLSFDTSSLPDDAIIVEATVGIVRVGNITGQIPIGVADSQWGDILLDYAIPSFGAGTQLTPADWESVPTRAGVSKFAWPAYSPDMTIYSRLESGDLDLINKTGSTQVRIRYQNDDDGDAVADYVSYGTGSNSTASRRPTLRVKYHLP